MNTFQISRSTFHRFDFRQFHLMKVSRAAPSRSKGRRADADGKGPSIWDEFCLRPGATADGSDGKIACDHYNRLESDLDLIQALGIPQGYRFSISWPRVQADRLRSDQQPNRGLDFPADAELVDGLLEAQHSTVRNPVSLGPAGGSAKRAWRMGRSEHGHSASRSMPESWSRDISATVYARSPRTMSPG